MNSNALISPEHLQGAGQEFELFHPPWLVASCGRLLWSQRRVSVSTREDGTNYGAKDGLTLIAGVIRALEERWLLCGRGE